MSIYLASSADFSLFLRVVARSGTSLFLALFVFLVAFRAGALPKPTSACVFPTHWEQQHANSGQNNRL